MDQLRTLIEKHGPSRASRLGELLLEEYSATPEAIRKRLSRARPPVRSFPIPLLPKREAFFYLQDDRTTERFWVNFLNALRETESVYGAAFDGLLARGGVVPADEFAVISGAPLKQKKHVPAALVASRLTAAGFVRPYTDVNMGEVIAVGPNPVWNAESNGWARQLAERVILDGVREWARKLGLASYNSIAIRGEAHPRLVGPFKWDLTGPSYLLPLRDGAPPKHQGFLVADVFATDGMTGHQLKYFVRKLLALKATKVGRVLPVIVAQSFTPEALTYGHSAGIVMATPSTLFGNRVGQSISDLLETLKNAGAVVAANPSRLVSLLENLSDIAGAAGNLRGILFELMVAYLVRNEGTSIDLGRKAFNPNSNAFADIDVLMVKGKSQCVCYECKGKVPGGKVTKADVDEWLQKLPVFKAYLRSQTSLAEAAISYEIWTSGEFEADALATLQHEKARRTNSPIDWKDGTQVRELSKAGKEKALTDAFDQHFFKHPLSN